MKEDTRSKPTTTPTILELAQLAAQLNATPRQEKEAIKQAMALWREAAREITEAGVRAEALRGIEASLFDDSPEDWRARIKAYPGAPGDVDAALSGMVFPVGDVQKRLWKSKDLSSDTRRRFWMNLPKASIKFGIEAPRPCGGYPYLGGGDAFTDPQHGCPIHPANVKRAKEFSEASGKELTPAGEVQFMGLMLSYLSAPTVCGHVARWAAEVARRQKSLSMKREIPQSKRQRGNRDSQDSIQYKRTFRS